MTLEKAHESYLFIKAQINALDTSKYIESEKARRDLYFDEQGSPTQKFYEWWIDNHAENFRNAWPTSQCRTCSHVISCKDCLKDSCQKYKEGTGGLF